MSKLFLHLLNISITAGWIVLVVVLLRFVLKKAPKWTRVVLWGLVALRLLLPVSIESVTSLVPSAETVKVESVTAPVLTSVNEYNGVSYFYKNVRGEQIVLQSGFPTLNSAVNPTPEKAAEHFDTVAVLKSVAGWVWLAGVVGMLFYALISFLRLRHRVRASVLLEKGAYVCDEISDPFILGLIVPKIYLPSGMDEQTRAYVLAHEKAHLSRFDHIWKPLGFLLLSVYWFNPLLWLAYILLCRDIELACDEKVVKELDDTGKAAYSEALVTASVSRRSIAACPLAFGETGVKSRVKSVLNYKKPAFWIILVAILACIAVAVCFLTMPKKNQPDAAELVGTWELSAVVADDREVSPGYYIDEGTGSETFTLRADGTGFWVWEYINPGISTYTIALTYKVNGNELTFVNTENPSSTLKLVYNSKKETLSMIGTYKTYVFHRVERDAAASDPTPDQLSGIWKTDGDSFGENRFLYGSLVLDRNGSAKLDLSTGSGPALQKEYTFALNKHYVCLSTDEGSVYGLYDPKTDTIFLPFKHSRSLSFTRTDDPVSSVSASPASAAQPLLGIWELVWMESTRTDAAVEEKQEEDAGSGMPFIATFPEEYELFYSGQKEYTMLLYENGTGDLLIQSGYSTAYATVHFDTDEQTIDQAGLDLYLHYHFDGDQLILDGDGFRVGFKRFDFISPSAAFASSSAEVLQWLDYYESSSDMPWDGTKEITHDAFPDVRFRWTAGSVEAIENGKTRTLFAGMPVWSVYFTDLTGDGKPELCSSVSFGSGIVDEHIVVYDYANKQSYVLWDRMQFDFHLYTVDGALYVGKTPYMGDKQVDYGTLELHDGVLSCRWQSDGSYTPLLPELHESELFGEWLVEEEQDANDNVIYTRSAELWKEYNFREDGTVVYNETVPVSSDYEKAFGHPVEYTYTVHDGYVHIEDGRSSSGYLDPQTGKLELNYQPSPGQYVYQTLRRMGEPEPSQKPYIGSWELFKIVDGAQEYDTSFLAAAGGIESDTLVLSEDGTGIRTTAIKGHETNEIALTFTPEQDETVLNVVFSESYAYGDVMTARYDSENDTISLYYPDDPTMYTVYIRSGSVIDAPTSKLTIDMLVGNWETEGNTAYDPPFLPGTLTFNKDGSAVLWLKDFLRSGEAIEYTVSLDGNMIWFADQTFASYDPNTDTIRLRLPLQSAGTLVFSRVSPSAEPTPEPIPDAVSPFDQSQYHKTVPVGEVPEEFKEVVAQNLFHQAIAGKDRLLTGRALATSAHLYTYQYTLRDRYGDLLTEVSIPIDSDSLYPGPAMIVSDGGFVATIVFEDHYRSEDQCWASEKEDVISCILKYDASGKLQWKTELPNINGYALHFCIERNGAYYFFGDLETPETKRLGVGSPTDLYLLKIGTDGSILKEQTYGGSDYDMIRMVDTDGDRFVIDARIQSTDGDFPAFSDWRITVDSDLAIVKKEQIENARNASYVGTVDGKRIYTDDPRFRSYPDGYVRTILSYDTFDLIISENMTGVYENQPLYISSIWYLSETVYAAYDKQGNLLWKAAVDSSPDYDSMVKLP